MSSLRGRIKRAKPAGGAEPLGVLLSNPGQEITTIEVTKLVVKRVDFVPGVGRAFDFCKRGIWRSSFLYVVLPSIFAIRPYAQSQYWYSIG